MNNYLAKFIATGFLSGLSPTAPGTVGSLAFLLLWILLKYLGFISSTISVLILLGALLLLAFYSVRSYISSQSSIAKDRQDPQEIVIDEWIGLAIPLAYVTNLHFYWILSAFFLFRFFDIIKPGPIKTVEKLPGEFGIIGDDLLAGIFALIILAGAYNWLYI